MAQSRVDACREGGSEALDLSDLPQGARILEWAALDLPRLRSLSLRAGGLAALPEAIAVLAALSSLDLSCNALSGQLSRCGSARPPPRVSCASVLRAAIAVSNAGSQRRAVGAPRAAPSVA